MPDLLLELFSEEIPARMQRQAAEDLKRLVTNALVEAGLPYEGAQSFATPRRLTLHVVGLPAARNKTVEERKGPRVGASEAAIQGFLKSAGLASVAEARIEKDAKKGEFYVAAIERPGRAAIEVIAELIPSIIRSFPWPKSMHWGDYRPEIGGVAGDVEAGMDPGAASVRRSKNTLRWVRPLHATVCTFGAPNETVEIVPFAIDGIKSGDVTYGHRFMAPAPIRVRRYDDYVDALFKAKVVLDAERRKQIILADARSLALARGLEIIDDEALLEEVAGLVEWPVVLLGEFDEGFLELPPEVIRATIRANQKCFVTRDAGVAVMAGLDPAIPTMPPGERTAGAAALESVDGRVKPGHDADDDAPAKSRLANKFILVANIAASDGGAAIAAGNARVVRARLADARHFWRTDLAPLPDYKDAAARPLDQRLAKLRALNIVFHEKLGTQGERVDRIVALAKELALLLGADAALAARAAELAKSDLVTEMVGEFPELQGLMGRYYAEAQGEAPEVAAAIEDHYRPQGPNDRVPTAPVSFAVALADKLDTLVGFWAIDEKPTGSKDPYALRRAALGVIRIVLENRLRLSLATAIDAALAWHLSEPDPEISSTDAARNLESARRLDAAILAAEAKKAAAGIAAKTRSPGYIEVSKLKPDLLAFFADRLKVYLRDKGARHDLIDAVFALPGQDDLLMIVRRVEALARFLDMDDGENLLAGYRRAANILKAEEKKDGIGAFAGAHDPALLALAPEKGLAAALDLAGRDAGACIAAEDFEGAMRALASLRAPVDAFFLDVTVNAGDPALRLNRLRLLNELRAAVHTVADFSKIAG